MEEHTVANNSVAGDKEQMEESTMASNSLTEDKEDFRCHHCSYCPKTASSKKAKKMLKFHMEEVQRWRSL
jgi:hypothetical protein